MIDDKKGPGVRPQVFDFLDKGVFQWVDKRLPLYLHQPPVQAGLAVAHATAPAILTQQFEQVVIDVQKPRQPGQRPGQISGAQTAIMLVADIRDAIVVVGDPAGIHIGFLQLVK